MENISFGEMRRKAIQYDELTAQLTELILLYKLSIPEIAKKAGISLSYLYRKLNDKRLNPALITKIIRVIIEENILMKA
jgi:predicted transcriptional regulator